MKCVKIKENGVVTRVSNETAKELVSTGEYTYSTKSAFKRVIRSPIGRAVRAMYEERVRVAKEKR